MKQALLDRIRVLNKYVTNKIMIHIAGKRFGHFAVMSHVGRKSGKLYQIPIIAEPVEGGFVIALTYGKKVDWYENVAARGRCSIKWKNQDYALGHPGFINRERALEAFPTLIRPILRLMGIAYYLRLETQP